MQQSPYLFRESPLSDSGVGASSFLQTVLVGVGPATRRQVHTKRPNPSGGGVGQSSAPLLAFQDRAESGPKSVVAELALQKSNGFACGPHLLVLPRYGEVHIRARTRSAPMPPLGLLQPTPGGRVFPRVTVPASDFPGMVHLLHFLVRMSRPRAPGPN